MILRFLRYLWYMIPVLASLVRDLTCEDLSLGEAKTHYLFGKANAYDQASFLNRSVKIYEKILKGDPKSIPVLLNLGGLYYRNERYEKSIPYYERVIRLNPKHYHAHYWLAMCYRKLGKYYSAINTLEEVIECLPTYKDALNLMGECYERIGEGAKAEHFYLKAISTDPNEIVIHGGLLDRSVSERKRESRIKH